MLAYSITIFRISVTLNEESSNDGLKTQENRYQGVAGANFETVR